MTTADAIAITEPTVAGGPIKFSHYALSASNPFAGGAAWVEGEYFPAADARISLLESGFSHSDVTYTVAHVWHGNFFRLSDHIDRLLDGAKAMRLLSPLTKEEIAAISTECVVRSQLRESYVSISLSRGVGVRPGQQSMDALQTQIYVYASPYQWIFNPVDQVNGVSAAVPKTIRWVGRNQIDPQVKNYQWGDLIQGAFEAADRGAATAILLDADDNVAEGPGFNVLIVKDGVVFSPAKNALRGITRRTALEIADAAGMPAGLRDVTAAELHDAEEIFVTTTAGGVTPIVELDGQPVGDGHPGAITQFIQARYWALMDEESPLTTPVQYRD